MKIFLFLLVIDLSRIDSSTKHAGNFLFPNFQFDFLCTGHPLASAGAHSDHSNTRGVECQAGEGNTFVFRFEVFLDYLDIAFAIWFCFVKLDQYGNKWCIFVSIYTLHSHFSSYTILGWTFTLEAFSENMRWKVVMALAQLLSWRGKRPTPWSRCWQGTQRKTMTCLSLQINATSSGRHHQLDAPPGLCLLSWWRARVQAICRGRFCFHWIECKKGFVTYL